MRMVILDKARLVAASINVERIISLGGCDSDIFNKDYQRLKEQLMAVRATDTNIRFLYLMGKNSNGALYFIVDSEPSTSDDYSPPGQIYSEAPASYRALFETRESTVIGAVTDRWGTWMSAFVPVKEPKTGELVAYFAADINAKDWFAKIMHEIDITVFVTIALLIITTILYLYLWRREESTKSEGKFRAIFENMQDVFYEVEIDGRVLEMSPSIEFVSKGQYRREDIIGKSLFEFYADPAAREVLIGELKKNGNITDYEVMLKNKDGSVTPCSVSAKICLGNPVKIIGSMRDITRRKQTDRQLTESEHRYRLLIDTAMEAILISQGGVYLKFVNPRATEMIGYSEQELLALPFSELIHPDDRQLVHDNYRKRTTGQPVDSRYKFRIVKKDKAVRWVEMSGTKIEWEGQPATLNMVTDITEQRETEESLKKSRELFSKAFATSPDAININRMYSGEYVAINDGFTRTTGYTEKDVIGRVISIWVDPGERKCLVSALEKYGEVMGFEAKFRMKDGRQIIGLMSAKIIENNDEKHIISITRDITDRKQAELALIAAKDQADAANLAKSQFLANMSHEIRTPLNGIIGFADMLLIDGELNQDQRESLDIIKKSGCSLVDLISDILDISKIEAGKEDVNKAPFDLYQILTGVTDLLSPKARLNGISLTVDYPPETPMEYIGDGRKIKQIVTNLVANAVKFTHQGKVEISARFKAPECILKIKDTGIGIPADKIARLGEKFYQGDSSITRGYGGTGLGLSISMGLARLMGGSISVESEVGKGSVFTVKFPLDMDSHETKKTTRKITKRYDAKILVVDDDFTSRKVCERYLKSLGCKVDAVDDGISALFRLKDSPCEYDVVLMDCQMPRMDGYATTVEIRKLDSEAKHVPIIATTAHVGDGEREKCIAAGMDDYLPKPLNLDNLAEKISHWSKSSS